MGDCNAQWEKKDILEKQYWQYIVLRQVIPAHKWSNHNCP